MTKLFEEAIDKARQLPEPRQDDAAHMLLSIIEQETPDAPQLTAAQVAEVRQRLADDAFASDHDVEAFFRRAGA